MHAVRGGSSFVGLPLRDRHFNQEAIMTRLKFIEIDGERLSTANASVARNVGASPRTEEGPCPCAGAGAFRAERGPPLVATGSCRSSARDLEPMLSRNNRIPQGTVSSCRPTRFIFDTRPGALLMMKYSFQAYSASHRRSISYTQKPHVCYLPSGPR